MKDKDQIHIKVNNRDQDQECELENAGAVQNEKTDDIGKHTEEIPSGNELLAEVEAAREESRQSYDKYLRVAAEFDNFKKRSAKENEEFKKYANEVLVKALLSVVDNLERAIKSVKEEGCDIQTLLKGVELTHNEILKILNQYQVKKIDALGEMFDPNFHQAMMQEISDEHPDNTVLQELQKGYTLHNRLLRPAMVIVSKTTEK
jgi:molecular chaperone GrpE